MKKLIFSIVLCLISVSGVYSEPIDDRPVVGVAKFSGGDDSPYTGLVTEKVVQILTNSKRFRVVDRTSRDKIDEELELQKNEAFIDCANLAVQGSAVAAEKLLTGEIVKIPVYRIKNSDGTVRGYKASVSFQMKIVDVATGISTDATSFEGKASKECLSPESAITTAMTSLQSDMEEYFRLNFPITGKLVKILKETKGAAESILIKAGKMQGVKIGDKFKVQLLETLDGEVLSTDVAIATVEQLQADAFSECKVEKKYGHALLGYYNANSELRCSLIVK